MVSVNAVQQRHHMDTCGNYILLTAVIQQEEPDQKLEGKTNKASFSEPEHETRSKKHLYLEDIRSLNEAH